MNENNISLREVDESLRQDRISALVKKYRWVFIGIVIAVVLAVVVQEVFSARNDRAARERFLQVEALLASSQVEEQAQALSFMNETAQIDVLDAYAQLRNVGLADKASLETGSRDILSIEAQLLQADAELAQDNLQAAQEIYRALMQSQAELGGLYSVVEALYLSAGGELADLELVQGDAPDSTALNESEIVSESEGVDE